MVYTVPHYIAGKLINEQTAPGGPVYNPALGERIGTVAFANHDLCNKAVTAAKEAWHSWSQTSPIKRAHLLFKFRELLEKNQLELARIVTREHGKTLEDAKGSVARAIEVVEYHCGIASQLQGSFSLNVATNIDCHTIRQPLGICAGISPFNFPVMVPVWMIVPAIACGNTFILKPSEQDPSAPIKLLELLHEAGLPDGVVNCVQGDKTTVEHLLHHPDIAAFTAVASTPVAKSIYNTAIAQGKRAHTFGGAKNHGVVMPDASLAQAANAIVGAAYGAAGERCMALSVIVTVGDNTAELLIEQLIPLINAMQINAGDQQGAEMGPLISHAHRERVIAAINQGVLEGATLVIDGRHYTHPQFHKGFFLGPTLFDNVTETMSVYQNEIFGPVLVIVRVATLDHAIDLINRNQYGNGTAIFTGDGYTAREYAERIQVGMVGVNIPIPVPVASHPFGGWKQSCFGDTAMHGQESIHFYTKLKTITSKWPSNEKDSGSFAMPAHR